MSKLKIRELREEEAWLEETFELNQAYAEIGAGDIVLNLLGEEGVVKAVTVNNEDSLYQGLVEVEHERDNVIALEHYAYNQWRRYLRIVVSVNEEKKL